LNDWTVGGEVLTAALILLGPLFLGVVAWVARDLWRAMRGGEP
jgi:hypothetical protein